MIGLCENCGQQRELIPVWVGKVHHRYCLLCADRWLRPDVPETDRLKQIATLDTTKEPPPDSSEGGSSLSP